MDQQVCHLYTQQLQDTNSQNPEMASKNGQISPKLTSMERFQQLSPTNGNMSQLGPRVLELPLELLHLKLKSLGSVKWKGKRKIVWLNGM